jgi:hypothetical protein
VCVVCMCVVCMCGRESTWFIKSPGNGFSRFLSILLEVLCICALPFEFKAWLILIYFYKIEIVSSSISIFIIRVSMLKLNYNIFRHRWKCYLAPWKCVCVARAIQTHTSMHVLTNQAVEIKKRASVLISQDF